MTDETPSLIKVRLDELDPTSTPSRDHILAAMSGLTNGITVAQILSLIEAGDIPTLAALGISYDKGEGPLTAVDVQAALDELAELIRGLLEPDDDPKLSAAAVSYDPGAGPLSAEKVQAALDELASLTRAEILQLGQCRLALDGANLRLSGLNGQFIKIGGIPRQIPSTGVVLPPTGATALTPYFIYAFMDAEAMDLERSTTIPALHTDGTSIKAGDPTRALVGMAMPIAGPAWVDNEKQRYVRSWFNDPGVIARAAITTTRSTASSTYLQINAEIRTEFLAWAGEKIELSATGFCSNSTAGGRVATTYFVDGNQLDGYSPHISTGAANDGNVALHHVINNLPAGPHWASLYGRASGGTANWGGSATPGDRVTSTVHCTGVK